MISCWYFRKIILTMASIQETLAKIKNDELRTSSLNFNDAYDSILQEERAKNQDITQLAQQVFEENKTNLEELRKANEKASIAESALNTSLEFSRANRAWLSSNVAWQVLSQWRQVSRENLAKQRAEQTAAEASNQASLLQAQDVERQRDAELTRQFQANTIWAAQASANAINEENRLDARTIASEIRGEARSNRLSDAQLNRDVTLTNAQIAAQSASLDPNVAALFWSTNWSLPTSSNDEFWTPTVLPATWSSIWLWQWFLNLIEEFEWFDPNVYLDPVGVPTQWFWFTWNLIQDWPITKEQWYQLLWNVARDRYLKPVLDKITVPLNQNQIDALTSFSYNLWPWAWWASDLVPLINSWNFTAVAELMKKYNRAWWQVLNWLVRRRNAEAELFLRGVS